MTTDKDSISLPHDESAERAVLGSLILYSGELLDTAVTKLKPYDFYNPKNRELFNAILELFNQSRAVDVLLIKDVLSKRGSLDLVGEGYIALVVSEAVPPEITYQLIDILKEKSTLRALIESAQKIISKAKSGSTEINQLLEEAESIIFQVTESKETIYYYSLGEVLKETLRIINELAKKETVVTGIPTGFYELDRLTTGFHPGDLVIIAARPGMGKTSFALSILHHLSVIDNVPTAFFSLEMSKEQIAMRLLGEETRIPLKKIRSGFLNEKEIENITQAALKMINAPLFIDDTASLSILDLKAKARRLKKEKDVQLIVVDYLQLLRSHRRVENRQQEVAEISRGLKGLAKELGIPVIALAQLSRQAEMRADKRPQLADLRESGSIEQDADLVIFIHRPEYYKKNPSPQEEGIAEIIIAKQRNGPTGTINLAFIKEITKFENLAKNIDNIEEEIEEDFEEVNDYEEGVDF
ncbi:MAG: replicative DNA helicase [Sulfurihydrogenibium sp.]|nr:MAG: replicative DNA helicase [Sulfurihydrogenibium sp.]